MERFQTWTSAELLEQIEPIAESENMTIDEYIETALWEHLKTIREIPEFERNIK